MKHRHVLRSVGHGYFARSEFILDTSLGCSEAWTYRLALAQYGHVGFNQWCMDISLGRSGAQAYR